MSFGQAWLWLSAGVYGTKTLINRICHSQDQKKRKKQPFATSCQQSPAFYVITMFIGFLFSQWQKGHLPTAALQSSSKISCETYRGADQSSLTPPIQLQFKKIQRSLFLTKLYNHCVFQKVSPFASLLCTNYLVLGGKWSFNPPLMPTVIIKLNVTLWSLNIIESWSEVPENTRNLNFSIFFILLLTFHIVIHVFSVFCDL